jgi:hypothetical protein
MDVSGAYRSVWERIGKYQSCQNTPIRQLKYRMRIARESHPHPYRIRIRYEIRCYFVESGQHRLYVFDKRTQYT